VVFQGIYNTGNLEFKKNYRIFALEVQIIIQSLQIVEHKYPPGPRLGGPDLAFRRVLGLWHDG
jgi:hypothetical protein